jgi:hypothetical protein
MGRNHYPRRYCAADGIVGLPDLINAKEKINLDTHTS